MLLTNKMIYQVCNRCKTRKKLDPDNYRMFKTGRWSSNCNPCREYFKIIGNSAPYHKRTPGWTVTKADIGSFKNICPDLLKMSDIPDKPNIIQAEYVHNDENFPSLR